MADEYVGPTTWPLVALMHLQVDNVNAEHTSVQKLDAASRTVCWPTRALEGEPLNWRQPAHLPLSKPSCQPSAQANRLSKFLQWKFLQAQAV